MSSHDDNNNVTFNVGGRMYQVRRSFLDAFPNTLLARAASKEWRNDDDEGSTTTCTASIFIDRDGERFRYVLDYMRDGKVHLPLTESKAALLHELQYFGFEDVDGDSLVNATSSSFLEAANGLVEYGKQGVEQAQAWSNITSKLKKSGVVCPESEILRL